MWDIPIFTIYKIYLIKFAAWTFRERWFTWGLSRLRKVRRRIWVLQSLIWLQPLLFLLWEKSLFSFVCLNVLCWVWCCFLLWKSLFLIGLMRLLLIGQFGLFLIRWLLRLYLTSRMRLFLNLLFGLFLSLLFELFLFCVLGLFLVPILFLVCCL